MSKRCLLDTHCWHFSWGCIAYWIGGCGVCILGFGCELKVQSTKWNASRILSLMISLLRDWWSWASVWFFYFFPGIFAFNFIILLCITVYLYVYEHIWECLKSRRARRFRGKTNRQWWWSPDKCVPDVLLLPKTYTTTSMNKVGVEVEKAISNNLWFLPLSSQQIGGWVYHASKKKGNEGREKIF